MNIYEKLEKIDVLTKGKPEDSLEVRLLLENDVSRRYFFSKMASPKWTPILESLGYFDVERNPKPVLPGGKSSPYFWDIFIYLDCLEDFDSPTLKEIASLFNNLNNQINAPERANAQTATQAIRLFTKLPLEFFDSFNIGSTLELYNKSSDSLLSSTLAYDLLGRTIQSDYQNKSKLVTDIFDILLTDTSKENERLRIPAYAYWIKKTIEKHGSAIWACSGKPLFELLTARYAEFDKAHSIDSSSHAWRPAIEEHSNNIITDDAPSIIAELVRELSLFLAKSDVDIIPQLLQSKLSLLKRIGLFCLSQHGNENSQIIDIVINNSFLEDYSLHHEQQLWIKNRIDKMEPQLSQQVFNKLNSIKSAKGAEAISNVVSALRQSEQKEAKSLVNELEKAKVHLDQREGFSVRFESGWVNEQPETPEKFNELEQDKKVELLHKYSNTKKTQFRGPTKEGAANMLQAAIKLAPLEHINILQRYTQVDSYYFYYFISGIENAWNEKKFSPDEWHNIYPTLVYILEDKKAAISQEPYHSTLKAISRLLTSAVKDDKNASPLDTLDTHKKCLLLINDLIPQDVDFESEDLYSSTINSASGAACEAFINYALRKARNIGKLEGWKDVEGTINQWISNLNIGAITSLASYIPNLLYLDPVWTQKSVKELLNSEDLNITRTVLEGYAHSRRNYIETYNLLKDHGALKSALEGSLFKKERLESYYAKLVTNAFAGGFDDISLHELILNGKPSPHFENAINYFWGLSKENSTESHYSKMLEFWEAAIEHANKLPEGKRAGCYSSLFRLAERIQSLDKKEYDLAIQCAPFALLSDDRLHSVEKLEPLSKGWPEELGTLFLEMISPANFFTLPSYPEESVKSLVRNIYNQNKSLGDQICIIYGEKGTLLLRDLYQEFNP